MGDPAIWDSLNNSAQEVRALCTPMLILQSQADNSFRGCLVQIFDRYDANQDQVLQKEEWNRMHQDLCAAYGKWAKPFLNLFIKYVLDSVSA